jgi:hypothetical protein
LVIFALSSSKSATLPLLTHCQTLLLSGPGLTSFLFHGIEFAHEQQDGGSLAIFWVELESVVNFLRNGRGIRRALAALFKALSDQDSQLVFWHAQCTKKVAVRLNGHFGST